MAPPKGVYPHRHIKPREYPAEIVDVVRRLYADGMTIAEIQDVLPCGYKAQLIVERYVPRRRPASPRDQRGERNAMWRGEDADYQAAHLRVASARGKASAHACVDCGAPAHHWSYDRIGGDAERRSPRNGLAYSTDPSTYAPRCRSCHASLDAARRRASRGGDA